MNFETETVGLLKDITASLGEIRATQQAHRALLIGLSATHPDKHKLLEHFQAQMDKCAELLPPDRVHLYSHQFQSLEFLITGLINAEEGRQAGG